MIKHRKKTLFIVTLSLLVITLPYLIDLKFVGNYIEKTLKNKYDIDISIQKTHWYWIPTPGIFLQNATVKHQALQSTVKLVAIYPRLSSLLRGTVAIKEIELITPEINILSFDQLSNSTSADSDDTGEPFPEFTLSISNGLLNLPFEGHLAVLKGRIEPLNLTINDLKITSEANTIQLLTSLTAPFASKVSSRIELTRGSPQDPLSSYVWDTNCLASNLDFSQIKKAALLISGDDEEVHKVFDNIYRCSIKKAGFSFMGTASDFSNMDNIVVTTEVEGTDIRIPDTQIVLTDSKGFLQVEDAVLYGSDLNTSLKNSFGTNGSFSLGLGENDYGFKLNFDIDADLSELQETIDEFITPSKLKQELEKVKKLTGRTPVNLKLADDLNDLKTYLFLPSLSGSFHYEPLQRDITFQEGVLDISPESVTWSNLTFSAGMNKFLGVSGSVKLDDNPFLYLTIKTADIDTKDVHQIVTAWPEAQKKMQKVLTGIDGKITLSAVNLSGPIQTPAEINYNFIMSSDVVLLSSPLLPGPTTLSFSSAKLSDKTITADQMNAAYEDSHLSATVNLNHTSFDRFSGSTIINGVAGQKISHWLRDKGWFNQSVFPRLPCKLSPLSLLITDRKLSITGNIIHKKDINTLLDIKVKDNGKINGSIEILSGSKNAVIQLLPPEKTGKEKIGISFDGEVSKATLNSVINCSWFPGDNLAGQFVLMYPIDKHIPASLNGSAEINHFTIPLTQNGQLLFDRLKINGNNDVADIVTENATIICPENLKGKMKEKLILSGLSSKLYFLHDEAALLRILSGNICDINITGDLNLPSKKLDFTVSLGKKKKATFTDFFACLGLENINISGNVSIYSEFKGSVTNISGSRLQLKATKGVIKKATLLAKILSLIDLTELFKKRPVSILEATGYQYDDIDVDAVIKGTKLNIIRGKINGSGLNLYGTGEIDLKTGEIDMIILASPFKTIDNLINSIPIIGETVSGKNQSILSVPLKVEGSLTNPEIRFLPKKLSSVSSDVIDVFVETFKLPFKISHKIVKPIQNQFKKQE